LLMKTQDPHRSPWAKKGGFRSLPKYQKERTTCRQQGKKTERDKPHKTLNPNKFVLFKLK
jgi:hypothetical protein